MQNGIYQLTLEIIVSNLDLLAIKNFAIGFTKDDIIIHRVQYNSIPAYALSVSYPFTFRTSFINTCSPGELIKGFIDITGCTYARTCLMSVKLV